MTISFEHIIILVIVAFLLYHLIGGCSCGMCSRDGFSVGSAYDSKNWYCGETGGFFGVMGKIECKEFTTDQKAKDNLGCELKDKSSYKNKCESIIVNGIHNILEEDTDWDDKCALGFKRIKCKPKKDWKCNSTLDGTCIQDAGNGEYTTEAECTEAPACQPPLPCSPNCLRLVPDQSKGNVSDFFNRIQKTYNDPDSNGVFISIIFNTYSSSSKVYLDGSGSIVRNDIYSYLLGGVCSFGFIWDIDWLENDLVSCLFPTDAITGATTGKCSMPPRYNNVDTCKLADTSTNGETPDRCSKGLQEYIRDYWVSGKAISNPTNCNKNIKYIIGKDPRKVKIGNGKNCFTSIVDEIKSTRDWLPSYNEAVFLKDVDMNGIEINEGIKKLTRLNKPTPVALTYIYNDDYNCSTDVGWSSEYKKQLKSLKLNFTPDTLVIKIYYDDYNGANLFEFKNHTTLDQLPGYNDV